MTKEQRRWQFRGARTQVKPEVKFNQKAVRWALASLNIHKSGGPDGISHLVLRLILVISLILISFNLQKNKQILFNLNVNASTFQRCIFFKSRLQFKIAQFFLSLNECIYILILQVINILVLRNLKGCSGKETVRISSILLSIFEKKHLKILKINIQLYLKSKFTINEQKYIFITWYG